MNMMVTHSQEVSTMKFIIERASGKSINVNGVSIEPRPEHTAGWLPPTVHTLEINTLDELVELMELHGHIIIDTVTPDQRRHQQYRIIIYDSYVE